MLLRDELTARCAAALVRRCEKGGCKLILDGLGPAPMLLDCDLYSSGSGHVGPICDYLIFIEGKIPAAVIAVEMKSRSLHARNAVEQLRGGAGAAEILTKGHGVSRFFPLLLSQAHHASELKVMRTQKVRFRGADYPVVWKRCGLRLKDISHLFQ